MNNETNAKTTVNDSTVSPSGPDGPLERAEGPNSTKMGTDTQSPMILKKIANMPPSYRATYRKAMRGKSLRAAANSICLECVGWQREEVRLCTSPACPLFPYRPYK